MSPEEIKNLKRTIAVTSLYYGKELADPVIRMYVEDLDDLEYPRVIGAMIQYRRDPKNRQMFLPAHIRAILSPPPNPETEAQAAVGRIYDAIRKHHGDFDEAHSFMGDLAWETCRMYGGYNKIRFEEIDGGTQRAQLVKLAKAIYEKCLAGNYDLPISLPEAQSNQALMAVKQLAESKNMNALLPGGRA